ncbi:MULTISPECIES: hypothetical protein [Actinomycetes]|uniref:hypothetical protein n=1 Tax=Actinomycetes TaxID=1760 RepID=UPI0033C78612
MTTPTGLPGQTGFTGHIPVLFLVDRERNVWRPTSVSTPAGERVWACPMPLDPDDQGDGPSFPWTERLVAAFFGPLTIGGAL